MHSYTTSKEGFEVSIRSVRPLLVVCHLNFLVPLVFPKGTHLKNFPFIRIATRCDLLAVNFVGPSPEH